MLKELDQSCTNIVDHLLTVEVHYGWGWQGRMSEASPQTYEPMEEPSNFHLRVNYFFSWQSVLRGGVGRIEEEGHVYNNFWIVFYTRPLGKYILRIISQHIACRLGLMSRGCLILQKTRNLPNTGRCGSLEECHRCLGSARLRPTLKRLLNGKKLTPYPDKRIILNRFRV